MDPTPVTTVHAGPAARRTRRRAGVGRSMHVAAACLLALTLLPSGALAVAVPDRGDGSPTERGSVLPIVLGGLAVVGLAGCLTLIAATSRRRAAGSEPTAATPAEPPPDVEQLLADALAARGGRGARWAGRRRAGGDGDRLPVWVSRLDPEMPVMPTGGSSPGASDDPDEYPTAAFVAGPHAEPGEVP